MVRKFAGAVVTIAAALFILGAPAGAHVTVQPGEAVQGSFATFAFQVPNERDNAATTQVEVTFPDGHGIEHLSVQPVPGWQVATETVPVEAADGAEATEAVSKLTWSGGRIEPGQFQRFFVSAGPLPDDADQLVFRAVQTYDNGEVVRWIEDTPEGGEEPEHPAPVLTLTAGTATGDAHGGGDDDVDTASGEDTDGDGGNEVDGEAAAPSTEDDDDGGDGLAIAALVVGIVALVLGGTALVRGRRPSVR
jgi:uncharacterized protein YcnI